MHEELGTAEGLLRKKVFCSAAWISFGSDWGRLGFGQRTRVSFLRGER